MTKLTKVAAGHYEAETAAGTYTMQRHINLPGYYGLVWTLDAPDGRRTIHATRAECVEELPDPAPLEGEEAAEAEVRERAQQYLNDFPYGATGEDRAAYIQQYRDDVAAIRERHLTKRQRRARNDARTAWRHMTAAQRAEFLAWTREEDNR